MLGRFSRDAGSPVGVEIAGDSVRMVHLGRHRRQVRVMGWAIERFEPAATGHWLDAPEPALAAVRRAWRRCGGRQRHVVLALPAEQVICKRYPLPLGLAEEACETYLVGEAPRLFPLPMDDMALDFQPLPTAPQAPAEVLVGACRQSLLDPVLRSFEEVGLEVVGAEPDSLALTRLLGLGQQPQGILVRALNGAAAVHRWPVYGEAWELQTLGDRLDPLALQALLEFDSARDEGGYLLADTTVDHGLQRVIARSCRSFVRIDPWHGLLPPPAMVQDASASLALACGLARGAWA